MPVQTQPVTAPTAVEQAKVRRERGRIEAAIRQAELGLADARDRLRALQRRCTHPHPHRYSAQGDTGRCCSDCGAEV